MAYAAYWIRAIGRLWGVGQPTVRLTYTARDGSTKRWTGRLRTMGMNGPYIEWEGKPALLCPWEKLISVEDARADSAANVRAERSEGLARTTASPVQGPDHQRLDLFDDARAVPSRAGRARRGRR